LTGGGAASGDVTGGGVASEGVKGGAAAGGGVTCGGAVSGGVTGGGAASGGMPVGGGHQDARHRHAGPLQGEGSGNACGGRRGGASEMQYGRGVG